MARGPDPDEEQRGREAFDTNAVKALTRLAAEVIGCEHLEKLEDGGRCTKSFSIGVEKACGELLSNLH